MNGYVLKKKADIEKIDTGEIKISIKITKNEDRSFHFERMLYFQNKLTDAEKESLLNHSNNMPVTRALKNKSTIVTNIK